MYLDNNNNIIIKIIISATNNKVIIILIINLPGAKFIKINIARTNKQNLDINNKKLEF